MARKLFVMGKADYKKRKLKDPEQDTLKLKRKNKMILLNAICKLLEVIAIGSVATFVILFVSAWIRGEFKK